MNCYSHLVPPFLPQIHSHLSPNEGSYSVYSLQSQAYHCRGLGLHLCLLHALALPGGHPSEQRWICPVWLSRVPRPLPAHLPHRFYHFLCHPTAASYRPVWPYCTNPLPEPTVPPTWFRHHHSPHPQEKLQRICRNKQRRSTRTTKKSPLISETGVCVCVVYI